MNTEEKELTFGEKAVGISFNPSSMAEVEGIKIKAAALIDELNDQRASVGQGEQAAQFTLAIRRIQEGQMWGVKAATWRY